MCPRCVPVIFLALMIIDWRETNTKKEETKLVVSFWFNYYRKHEKEQRACSLLNFLHSSQITCHYLFFTPSPSAPTVTQWDKSCILRSYVKGPENETPLLQLKANHEWFPFTQNFPRRFRGESAPQLELTTEAQAQVIITRSKWRRLNYKDLYEALQRKLISKENDNKNTFKFVFHIICCLCGVSRLF